MWIASCAENPPSISTNQNSYYPGHYNHNSLIHKAASDFTEKKEDEPEESKKRTWEICAKAHEEADDEMRKRRLVSLFEANEVAKRVAGSKSRYGGRQTIINGGLVDSEGSRDIVSEWNQIGGL